MGDGTNPTNTSRNRKINEVAQAMIDVWNRVDPTNPVHPAEIANFADMARMLVDRYNLVSQDEKTDHG